MLDFLKLVFYEPIYNLLILLIDIVPGHNVAFSIVLTTLIVKFVLFPLAHKASHTQIKTREIEPEIDLIRKENKDRQEQAKKLMELYRKHKINPFSSILLILIQLPIIVSLYLIFAKSGLPAIDSSMLYSFIPSPESVNMSFLGFDVSKKSFVLAIFAGLSQFIQAWLLIPKNQPRSSSGEVSFKDEFARSLNIQMKYIFPIVVVVISYQFAAAVALYWLVGNIFTIGQELFTKHSIKRQNAGESKNSN